MISAPSRPRDAHPLLVGLNLVVQRAPKRLEAAGRVCVGVRRSRGDEWWFADLHGRGASGWLSGQPTWARGLLLLPEAMADALVRGELALGDAEPALVQGDRALLHTLVDSFLKPNFFRLGVLS